LRLLAGSGAIIAMVELYVLFSFSSVCGSAFALL
jgi:hypothetical protein